MKRSAVRPGSASAPGSTGGRKLQRSDCDWSKRSLEGKQYVYVWADGIHFNIRLEEDRQCILVLMGATADGKKELIAVHDGHRESEQSWKELLSRTTMYRAQNGERAGQTAQTTPARGKRQAERHLASRHS